MRYRANVRVVGQGGKELGRITYHVKAKNKAGALTKFRKLVKARKVRKNVEQGFFDRKGVFHPIRGSADYSPSRAGEARAAAKKARRRRTSIS